MDCYEFFTCTRAELVNGAGGEFLAGSSFPLDENGRTGGRDLFDRIEDLNHAGRLPDHVFQSGAFFDLLTELFVLLPRIALAESALDEEFQAVNIYWLGNKVVGSPAHGLHRGIHGAVGGHHDANRGLGELERLLDESHAVFAPES